MKRKLKLSDELRKAIAEADFSRYRLWQITGIDEATLSRFMTGKGGLSVDGLDRIAEALGLHITVQKPKRKANHGKHIPRAKR